MSTKLLIIGLLVIIALAAIYFVRGMPSTPVSSTPASGTGTTTLFPSTSATRQNTGTTGPSSGAEMMTMTIAGAGGVAVRVLDFMHATTTTQDASNQGLYHLDVPPSVDPAAPYDITYESPTQYFNISLLVEPIGQTRVAMEDDLMEKLGITEGAMCGLNYMVSVPYWVNDSYADINLGFSFCPGATVLPQ